MRAPAILAILTAAALLAALTSSAQSSATPVPAHKPAQVRGHSAKPAASKPAARAAPAQLQTPLAPELPNWPANELPSEASVVWDSHGLRIEAANSSLEQILDEVSAEDRCQGPGVGTDERVFGSYGPGATRDVASPSFWKVPGTTCSWSAARARERRWRSCCQRAPCRCAAAGRAEPAGRTR